MPMQTDALDLEIAAAEERAANLRRLIAESTEKLEQEERELSVLHRAAKLRPKFDPSGFGPMPPLPTALVSALSVGGTGGSLVEAVANQLRVTKGGRRPGSISMGWREVLWVLYAAGGSHTYGAVHEAAKLNQLGGDIASTRERVRSFVEHGFMSGNPDTGFVVMEAAANRFGFSRIPPLTFPMDEWARKTGEGAAH